MTEETRVERNQENYSRVISDGTYDKLRRSAEVLLPAIGALYFALSQVWGLPYGEQVVGTTAAINTFIGLLVITLRKKYNESDAKYDGEMVVSETDETKTFGLVLNGSPEDLEDKKDITFKVVK